jgi:hypothetical protein
MKIRINGNSVRIRLSKPEVELFGDTGYLASQTEFGDATFTYVLERTSGETFSASFQNNTITMSVPQSWAKEWVETNRVGFEGAMPIGNGKSLYLLLEKDFKCLDDSIEGQADNYDNPLAAKHK